MGRVVERCWMRVESRVGIGWMHRAREELPIGGGAVHVPRSCALLRASSEAQSDVFQVLGVHPAQALHLARLKSHGPR